MLWYTARSPCCNSTFPVAKKNNKEGSAVASHYVWDGGLEGTSEYSPGSSRNRKGSFQTYTKSLIPPSEWGHFGCMMKNVKFYLYTFQYKVMWTYFSFFSFGLLEIIMRIYESKGWGKFTEVAIYFLFIYFILAVPGLSCGTRDL